MSSLALNKLEQTFGIFNLEGILISTGSYVTGFLPVVAATTPTSLQYYIHTEKEPLTIVASSKQEALLLVGYLTAFNYHSTLHDSVKLLVDSPWPAEGWQARGGEGTTVVIKTAEQVALAIAPLETENFKMPAPEPGNTVVNLMTRRITWLTKPEDDLTEDDYDLIQKYTTAGFLVFIKEPQQLSIPSRQASPASAVCGEGTRPTLRLNTRRTLNALAPHTGMLESAFTSLITAAASGLPLPLPPATISRQKAAPSSSEESTPVGARHRTRTDSELSDYHDCSPPESIPRMFFPRDSRFSTGSDAE
jgi:hypothetical protein